MRSLTLYALPFVFAAVTCGFAAKLHAKDAPPVVDYSKYSQSELQKLVDELGVTMNKVMVPMRDGVGLCSDIYVPNSDDGPFPTIFWRTPYNFNKLSGLQLRLVVEALSRGYAMVIQNERGRYFSEGEFEILGHPRTDGYDALTWIADQDWSNGKVGTLGCSSSAEWQLALAAQDHPAHAAMVPMAAGAGIGRVGRFHEQGNWYTGGVPRTLFFVWLYGVDNPLRAQLPGGLDDAIRARVAAYNDLAAAKPKVDWKTHIHHLPVAEMLSELGEPPATFDEFIRRKPNDSSWFKGGLYHDQEPWGVPALWFNSWYDVSIGPNMELFNHAARAGVDPSARDNQYAVVAPTVHCRFFALGPNTTVGERVVGDTSFDTMGTIFAWFGKWLRDDDSQWAEDTPHVRYYTIGADRWQSADSWPPRSAESVRMYLHSDGRANSVYGDGVLNSRPPAADEPSDTFVYDPMNPVQTIGGGDCCNGGIVIPGAFDQRVIEARHDVLVYSSDPLEQAIEVTGFVDVVLHVSSDAKDTDFAVKLVDVAPDGTAYIVDDTILRARYRDGFGQEVMMEPGEVYRLQLSPMTTSTEFGEGHRIRVEVTSSNFPKFVRNLNTGGNNYDESAPETATNVVHHSERYPSFIVLPVVR